MAKATENTKPEAFEDDLFTVEDVLSEDYVVQMLLKQLSSMLEALEEHLVLNYQEDCVYACTLRDGIENTIEATFVDIKDYVDDYNARLFTE